MTFATAIATLSSRHLRRALRMTTSPMVLQKRCLSSIDCTFGSLNETAAVNSCDVLSARIEEDDRLLNDLAYSLSMASVCDSNVFPLGHEPNRRQQRQLWLSKTQPLLGQVGIEKRRFGRARLSDDEVESAE